MTVNTTKITSGPYVGNNIADTFSYTFKVDDKSQLKVFETTVLGVESVLTVDTDYTVSGIGNDGGGTILRIAGALPTDFQWFIRSDYEETQLTAFSSQGAFFPDLHEGAMDKLTLLIQQILDKKGRSPAVSDSYTGVIPLTMEDPVAGKITRWLGDLSGFENIDVSELDPSITTSDRVGFNFASMSEALTSTDVNVIKLGATITIEDRENSDWKVVSSGSVANSIYDSPHSTGLPSFAFKLKVTDSTVTIKQLGALSDSTTDIFALLQYSIPKYNKTVVTDGTYYSSGMVEILKDRGVYLSARAIVTKFAAFTTNSEPVFWLKGDNAILMGASMTGSLINSERNALDGVVLIGHRDMTASHANVNYCTLSGLRIGGATPFGQTDTSTDRCLVIQNPQFGGLTSYFHNINDIAVVNSNVGIEWRGWANAITGSNIHGFRLGNTTAGENAFLWLNGSLDITMSNFFFHQSTDSKGLKISVLDNTINGGVVHTPLANSFKGLVFEQGGTVETGINSTTASGLSYFEVVSNTSGGNVSTDPAFFTENTVISLGVIQLKSITAKTVFALESGTFPKLITSLVNLGNSMIVSREDVTGDIVFTIDGLDTLNGGSFKQITIFFTAGGVDDDGTGSYNNVASLAISGTNTYNTLVTNDIVGIATVVLSGDTTTGFVITFSPADPGAIGQALVVVVSNSTATTVT